MFIRAISKWLLLAFFSFLIFDTGAAAICFFSASRFVWNPDLDRVRSNWNTSSSKVDEEIGGPRVSVPKSNSEFPNDSPSCGSAYGDSFVFGNDVPPAEGWVEQLSHSLGCRVTNYAVGNYGTDQAYLHFRRIYDQSSIVLLGINPSNIEDNVNQYDGFLGGSLDPLALKGRFTIDRFGILTWQRRPQLGSDAFIAMHRYPTQTLPHSYFLPGERDGPVVLEFPYSLTLARVALLPRLHNVLMGRAEWSNLFAPNDPSGALQITVAISEAFVALAKARGKRALIILLPTAESFREQANYGNFEYAPLVAALTNRGIDVFDPGAGMLDTLAGRPACDLFVHHMTRNVLNWFRSRMPCGGHYSGFANTQIAKLVAIELRRRGLVSQ